MLNITTQTIYPSFSGNLDQDWFCLHLVMIIPYYHLLNPQLVYTDVELKSSNLEIRRDQDERRRRDLV